MSRSILIHAEADPSDAPRPLDLPNATTAADLLGGARAAGIALDDAAVVYPEDGGAPLAPDAPLAAGDGATAAFYVGSPVPIHVTVGYDGETAGRDFSPATRLRTVERWAARALEAPTQVPHRLALRFADTVLTPGENRPLGALDRNRDRHLRFDLVVEKDHPVEVTVIVNGRKKTVAKRELTFAEVVALADNLPTGPNIIYSVTYRGARGPKPAGTLVEGGTVKIKNRTIFNVTATDKS